MKKRNEIVMAKQFDKINLKKTNVVAVRFV